MNRWMDVCFNILWKIWRVRRAWIAETQTTPESEAAFLHHNNLYGWIPIDLLVKHRRLCQRICSWFQTDCKYLVAEIGYDGAGAKFSINTAHYEWWIGTMPMMLFIWELLSFCLCSFVLIWTHDGNVKIGTLVLISRREGSRLRVA